ncbi:YicC family protein [Deltaproteobacteria bacterium PRO3]|nr:YicC family protein [Deltaproteobacteria bacterium PRO3]
MIKSMTGYGIVQGKVGGRRVVIETKSVNHKFCEVNLRLSQRFSVLEGKIAEAAKSFFSRGRIDILVKEEAIQPGEGNARIDLDRLKAYHKSLKAAAQALKLPGDLRLEALINLPDVLITEEPLDLESLWRQLESLLRKSFVALEKMRQKEGLAIAKFFRDELKFLSGEVQAVEKIVPGNVEHHRQQLNERVARLASGVELDPQRLAQEVAYFVDRTDISEELQRLKHHIAHFGEILDEQGPLGRKLDFLLQEMNREANTLSAKAQSAEISQKVVNCKHCLEKLREQVQNVE